MFRDLIEAIMDFFFPIDYDCALWQDERLMELEEKF